MGTEKRVKGKYKLKLNGEEVKYPSVTTVLGIIAKPVLYYWYGKHGTQKCQTMLKEAGVIGSGMHHYIEDYFDPQEGAASPKQDPKLITAIRNFHTFADEYKPKKLMAEFTVASHTYKYAGTLDGLYIIQDKLTLLDWKSSARLYPESKLQVEAYYQAYCEMRADLIDNPKKSSDFGLTKPQVEVILGNKEPQQLWIVRFDKENDIDVDTDIYKGEPNPGNFKAFCAAIKLYNWNKIANRKPKKEDK